MRYPQIFSVPVMFTACLLIQGCTQKIEAPDASATGDQAAANVFTSSIYASVPVIEVRSKKAIDIDGYTFKDLNANGVLDTYEDWRESTGKRIADLLSQMTLQEKVGMMMIDTLNADWGGIVSENSKDLIVNQGMTRFIFRNNVTASPVKSERSGFGGQAITVLQAAEFTNNIQSIAENTRLGIPVVFKSNARNHYEKNARVGVNAAAGSFSEWPKEAGLAATRDDAVLRHFATAMAAEWKAVGLRGMYGYMADISTEPRWFRNHETFTEDADLANHIITELVKDLQGGPVSPDSGVVLTVKHFPGGGPQLNGLDPHYTFGKYQVYPAGKFEEHLKPFIGAIDAGVSSIMPYYGIPVDLTYDGVTYQQKGMAFSKAIVTDLLRTKLGFKGYVNSDTGIISSRAWGLEDATVSERIAAAINAGIDVLSGFHSNKEVADLVDSGIITEARVNEAVAALLWEQFQLGLFENPYVDATKADQIVGKDQFKRWALDAQQKSIVVLKNTDELLPLPKPTLEKAITLLTLGVHSAVVADQKYGGYTVVSGDSLTMEDMPENADYALIRVEVSNPREATAAYKSNDKATGGRINHRTGKSWGVEDGTLLPSFIGPDAALDDTLMFGGPAPYEADFLSFSKMANASTWEITPSLDQIQKVMTKVGAKKTIVSIYFRQPYVLDNQSGLKTSGALLATFGVSDTALMDVVTGQSSPQGKLPFALPRSIEAVLNQASDAAGFSDEDTLFPFGFGLTY